MSGLIPKAEVSRVCQELGLSDWTALTHARVTIEEARSILAVVKPRELAVDPEIFRAGLEVELEHGLKFPEANVTNNHPVLTGRIVVAHLLEVSDYYERLKVVELDADLSKAIHAGDLAKIRSIYGELLEARQQLVSIELEQLKGPPRTGRQASPGP